MVEEKLFNVFKPEVQKDENGQEFFMNEFGEKEEVHINEFG